jgi:SAM-dependent methyltransferase
MKEQQYMTSEAGYSSAHILETMQEAVNYNQFLLQRIVDNAPQYQSQQTVVDFGAGIGTFAELVKQRGFDVICIEYDDQLRNHLNVKLGYTAYKTLNEMDAFSMKYIYSLNVLEHIENDEETINDIFKALDKNGLLYLYVPAFNLLYSTMDKKVGHFRRYRYRELREKLEKAGFEIKKWQYVDSIGFVVSLFYRWVGDESGEVNRTVLKFYDRVLFPISRVVDMLLKKILGKNLEIIAKKN